MDAFFASVEQRDNPKLKNKPVIVGGNPQNRGVVAACSYEARRYGIHSAMPCSKAVRLCPDAIFIRPNMHRYKEISQQIMAIFRNFTQLVEPLSLDEAFLDVTVNKQKKTSATWIAEAIRKQVFNETHLTASAGISFNKFLAKVASDVNKPDGIHVVPPEESHLFLSKLPIGKFYGVGKVTRDKMNRLGIYTGADLLKCRKSYLTHHFGKAGSFFYDIVRGNDQREVQCSRERKSIGSEITLNHDTSDPQKINTILEELAFNIEQSLTKLQLCSSTVTLKVRYSDFTTITRSITKKHPIYTKKDILFTIPKLLQSTDVGIIKVRLLGITVSNLNKLDRQLPIQRKLPFPNSTL